MALVCDIALGGPGEFARANARVERRRAFDPKARFETVTGELVLQWGG
jgi:hypothetical protein